MRWAQEHPEAMAEIAALPQSEQLDALRSAIAGPPTASLRSRPAVEVPTREQEQALHDLAEAFDSVSGERVLPLGTLQMRAVAYSEGREVGRYIVMPDGRVRGE